MKIYYFSSTGNSLYVSKKIKEALNENVELISMTKALRDNDFICDDNAVGFIYPIHCGSLPIIALDFLCKLKLKKNSYVFAVGVSGGGEAKSSFVHINEIIKDTNILSNFVCIKYISNYIRAGRNPSEKRAIEAIDKNEKILEDFINEINERKIKKCNYKFGLNKVLYSIWKNVYKNKDKKFNVNNDCIGCEICKKACPVDNIIMKNNIPTWKGNCTDCMACINLCPKKAINIGKSTVKKNRYKNPYIKVNELIS